MSIFTGHTAEQDPHKVEWNGSSLYLCSSKVGSRMTPMGPEYVAPYARPPLRRYTGQVFMQAPQRMHLSECQKSAMPSRRLRPLSTSTMCNSPPLLGPVKWEEYCVSGAPSPLRANSLRNTPKSSTRGMIFSMPMLAMCSGGTGCEEPRTRVVPHRLGEHVRIVVVGIRADRPGKQRGLPLPRLLIGRKHNVAGRLAI